MPENVQYKILERRVEKEWEPFAVAYWRGDRFVLFCPAWRRHRDLAIESLDDLVGDKGAELFTSSGFKYRWSPLQKCDKSVSHPIELLKCGVALKDNAAYARSVGATEQVGKKYPVESRRSGALSRAAKAGYSGGQVVNILVNDLSPSSTYLDSIPFKVSPESKQTIIPRKLVAPGAFPVPEANRCCFVEAKDLSGRSWFGLGFSACLALTTSASDNSLFEPRAIEVVVVDSWDKDYALLGGDVLT